MKAYLLKNATVVNESSKRVMDVLIRNNRFERIDNNIKIEGSAEVIDATGLYLLPGLIDDQVHFREPGLTHKADIYTESRAAVAGGITSFMEMPNVKPQTLTQELLQAKYDLGSTHSIANYSFYMGTSNDNLEEVVKTDPKTVCGIKIFMGSSTGSMLVDQESVLEQVFANAPTLIATHCEDEDTIKRNTDIAVSTYGEDIPFDQHPVIRSEEACWLSSSKAVALAQKHNTRLHILHISTARETDLFDNSIPLSKKQITSEACVHHLWFSNEDYQDKGAFIKWNPAVKTPGDREGIWKAVLDDRIDVIATDHAPHTLVEKSGKYLQAPSGGPLVQHVLVGLLESYHDNRISLERIVEKTSHAVADCFKIIDRGYIREGYYADCVLVDLDNPWEVKKDNILYKCGWSPFEGQSFRSRVQKTFVSGKLVYDQGAIVEAGQGMRLMFNR